MEQIFDVWWDDPCDEHDLDSVSDNCVLYMICGTHGLYGRNVPLYLGMTSRSLKTRISEHSSWLIFEADPVKIYPGFIGEFKNWEFNLNPTLEYPPLPEEKIKAVEALLILAHQPVYNSRSKQSASSIKGNIRIFNTGRRAILFPEVSSQYWVGDPTAPGSSQPDDGVPKGKR